MTAIQLTRTVYDGIVAHAREGKPEEICGILRGRAGRAGQLYIARAIWLRTGSTTTTSIRRRS